MLRAALWQAKGDYAAATRTAAAPGRLLGQLLINAGVLLVLLTGTLGGLWLAMIGWFLLLAAEAEAQAAVAHVALSGLRVRDAMVAAPVTVEADLSLERFMDDVFLAHRFAAYPVVDRGAPIGLVTYRDAAMVPRPHWPGVVVRNRTTPLEDAAVVHPDDLLETHRPRCSARQTGVRSSSAAGCCRRPTSCGSSRPGRTAGPVSRTGPPGTSPPDDG